MPRYINSTITLIQHCEIIYHTQKWKNKTKQLNRSQQTCSGPSPKCCGITNSVTSQETRSLQKFMQTSLRVPITFLFRLYILEWTLQIEIFLLVSTPPPPNPSGIEQRCVSINLPSPLLLPSRSHFFGRTCMRTCLQIYCRIAFCGFCGVHYQDETRAVLKTAFKLSRSTGRVKSFF
jgi:hypothetical protein